MINPNYHGITLLRLLTCGHEIKPKEPGHKYKPPKLVFSARWQSSALAIGWKGVRGRVGLLRVETLLLHINRSQLRWVLGIWSERLLGTYCPWRVFWGCRTQRRLLGADVKHSGETTVCLLTSLGTSRDSPEELMEVVWLLWAWLLMTASLTQTRLGGRKRCCTHLETWDRKQQQPRCRRQEKKWKNSIIVSALISWCEFSRDICLK